MEINTRTQLCGLLGNPVEHSLSPAIHNAAFEKLGLNFVYLAFKVEDLPGAVKGLRALGNLRGFSVTIPHKVAIMPLLDDVEQTARNIGAVNTIVIENGRLLGSNTDASGALRALTEAGATLRGENVVLLGSGGAARAIAFALAAGAGIAKLTLLGIDEKERAGLAKDLKARTSLQLADGTITDDALRHAIEESKVLLHCTPLGMHPNVRESCVPASLLKPHLTVMDIVYNPLDTKLLTDARAAGCKTIRGLEMFLNQAVGQFELWTKQKAPADVMRKVLESRFS
ncbi:MAG: shikimate dehydrogenase [Nitrospiraceae bacterium]|nr:shikimate dehydrogenase [Nitrospiraceae bacterium]MSR24205.1 shikimate dehydrogenase [Nitrospiraceae bacterium]